jgi:hypothetical protein
VPYARSIALQRSADLLLLLLWGGHPLDRGVVTGKVFEYIAARRPILGIGPDGTEAAQLMGDRAFVSTDWRQIAAYLRACLAAPRSAPLEADERFSRAVQSRQLEEVLTGIVGQAVAPPAPRSCHQRQ